MLILEKAEEKVVKTEKIVLQDLYKQSFPFVAKFVARMGGSFQDAKDVFHDALIIFYEKQREGTLEISYRNEAYILGIAKHLWVRKFKADSAKVSLDDWESALVIPEDYFPESGSEKLLQFLELTGRRCLDILRAFYYDKMPVKKIASVFGYSTIRSATVQKYKCLEKVRTKVKEKSLAYDDFLE